MILIPKKIQPYFTTVFQKNEGNNTLIKGILTCCNDHDFEVLFVGNIRHTIFSKMHLTSINDKLLLKIRCKKCGEIISVFDSSCDGYEQCEKKKTISATNKTVDCIKCQNESFSVTIIYEYPDIQELKELGISEIENAFTWIWITLECNNCGTRYKNFVDYDTT